MTALTGETVRVPAKRQTAAERAAVYDHVWLRDEGKCLAPRIDPTAVCHGEVQRHHAGLRIGMAKKTDVLHVGLLCVEHNFGGWARIWDRAVMACIAAREAAWQRDER